MSDKPTLLLVDDEPTNLRVLRTVLHDDYRLLFAKSGEEALQLVAQQHPALVLLDVMMPAMTGYEVCARLKANPATAAIPVIFVTALKDEVDETKGFAVGAVDYIAKPVSPAIVRARVKTHLSLVRADELKQTRLQVIQRLGRAAEYKDNETGLHVMRMSHYAQILARAYGLSEQHSEDLLHAAPMHDIGKIGIADSILLKPGKLTADEYREMQKHPLIGAEILGECDSALLKMAKAVALYHHEKWDGSGYPHGLAGDAIPVEARIVAVSDVFDALTSARPYKQAWSIEDTMAHMQAQKGLHFEPRLIDLLQQQLPAILAIKQRWAE
ncbi:MAG: response regulator [Gammaproteobacteria bacterium]|nr:response regulator [Gammaproteobacteria bacterium]MBU1556493.1 response regulator [Gammaproteobacteria bacterium]MBU2070456.1 response regulator [Gammaproteobacteria bacterium]MBU2185257.1 response regulator [Gammaproteobacteria bacterium]MBU2205048.1 response regulator [Gammaproteobacteria bacterium]